MERTRLTEEQRIPLGRAQMEANDLHDAIMELAAERGDTSETLRRAAERIADEIAEAEPRLGVLPPNKEPIRMSASIEIGMGLEPMPFPETD